MAGPKNPFKPDWAQIIQGVFSSAVWRIIEGVLVVGSAWILSNFDPFKLRLIMDSVWMFGLYFVAVLVAALAFSYVSKTPILTIKRRLQEKGYKLNAVPVLEVHEHSQDVEIRIDSEGKFRCIAELIKVVHLEGTANKEIDINYLNPRKLPLAWDNNYGYADLTGDTSRLITLLSVSGANASFIFSGYKLSPSLDGGKYLVQVDVFRKDGNGKIRMASVERVLNLKPRWASTGHMFESSSRLLGFKVEWLDK